jgi:hypothetical protein
MKEDVQYVQQAEKQDGTGQGKLIDPQRLRYFVFDNLRGIRKIKETLFRIILVKGEDEGEVLEKFWAENHVEANKEFMQYKDESEVNPRKILLDATSKTRKVEHQVDSPMMNETGAYHLLQIFETCFSKHGYLSNLTENEVNDMIYEDILIPSITSIVKNHDKYEIDRGSRDEVVGFVTHTCKLILNASIKGWTGDRLGRTMQEKVVAKSEEPVSSGMM